MKTYILILIYIYIYYIINVIMVINYKLSQMHKFTYIITFYINTDNHYEIPVVSELDKSFIITL